MSRLTIEVTEQQHQHIKALAALQGKSIKEYALQRLFALTADEEKALQDLKLLLAPRIAEGHRGEVSPNTFEEIVDEAIGSGGPA